MVAKEYIDQGQLVPDDLIIDLLAQVLDENKENTTQGVIFDGYPRTIPQAEALEGMLAESGTQVDAVVGLEVPDEELIKRIVLRGEQSGRADDNEETIKKRLVVYHSQTQPLIEWYKQEGLHHHINGLGTLERIFADIQKVMEQL
jgi:adenylate kinase